MNWRTSWPLSAPSVCAAESTGGKLILGKTSKMGQRDIRRLLIIGAMAVVRWTARRGAPKRSWLAGMIGRKPRLVIAIALPNKRHELYEPCSRRRRIIEIR
ncbi:hypothetical protein MES5069_450046 [Mesorhizobium escarrei]|uniref:Transposase n=1 Tax=Mesorhizobium escarrei TaxID=666018 RepID=A0ABM9E7J4_9HYPH|nr:hypothetical protein MES5069_450046 [Mesorhizobium escarrei]